MPCWSSPAWRAKAGLWNSARRTAELESSEGDLAGNFLIARDGRVLACNEAFAHILGFASKDEALGSNTAGALCRARASGRGTWSGCDGEAADTHHESSLVRRDGITIDVLEKRGRRVRRVRTAGPDPRLHPRHTDRKAQEAELARGPRHGARIGAAEIGVRGQT